MGKRLHNIRGRLGIPSGRAIIHIIVVEIIINVIWNQVSKVFTTPLIKEIGFLVLTIAGLFAVAWYLPKLSSRWSGASESGKEEDSHIKELLDFYEEQKSKHRDYIHIDLLHVDCSQIEAATPHVILKISFRNYLPDNLKILKIEESKGTVDAHVLPRLSLDREYIIGKCGETTHEFILEIQGTDIPRHIKEAGQFGEAMEWVFTGWWKAEVFGEIRDILVPAQKLTWKGIPNFEI